MAFQPETATYDAGVLQLETTTPVQGGVGGASNAPLLSLSNRTAYLKAHVDALETQAAGLAPLNGPLFTGDPRGPTPASGDNDTSFATTAFVQNAVGGSATVSCAGGANVNLTAVQAGAAILLLTGVITANIALIVPTSADRWIVVNNTTGAFTLTVKTAAGTGVVAAQGFAYSLLCDGTNVLSAGGERVPTPAQFDNSQLPASTAFVQRALGNTQGLVGLGVGASTVLTAADVGKVFVGQGGTVTLPPTTGLASGSMVAVFSTANTTVQRSGTDTLQTGPTAGLTSLVLGTGDFARFINNANVWVALDGTPALGASAAFAAIKSTNGYQRMPTGVIFQWGNVAVTSAADVVVTLPIACPSAILGVITSNSHAANAPIEGYSVAYPISLTQIGVRGSNASSTGIYWFAIGF